MSRFVQVDRDTAYLLPPSVQEWLPADHLARYVVDVVEALDLSALVHRLKTREGRALYALRKSTVETVIGIITRPINTH